jgi:hypothetical protein
VLPRWEVGPLGPGPLGLEDLVAVGGGRFEHQIDLSHWPPGAIEVWVGFELYLDSDGRQPREVVEWFGPQGENLTGPNVEDWGEFRRVTDLCDSGCRRRECER